MPPLAKLESKRVLKSLADAHRILGELKGHSDCIANNQAVQNALLLLEARESARIDGAAPAGFDEIFIADAAPSAPGLEAARRALRVRNALMLGWLKLAGEKDISEAALLGMHRLLTASGKGYRTVAAGMKSAATGKVFLMPPRSAGEIRRRVRELLHFVNGDAFGSLDPLVRAAAVQHRFLSIHPFAEGNGRMARMLFLLQLVRAGAAGPALPAISGSLYAQREAHRRRFEAAASGDWEEWTLCIVHAAADAADATLALARSTAALIEQTGLRLRGLLPRAHSAALLEEMFRRPCMRIEATMKELEVTRVTASKHLNALARHGFAERRRVGKRACFLNMRLARLLAGPHGFGRRPDASPRLRRML